MPKDMICLYNHSKNVSAKYLSFLVQNIFKSYFICEAFAIDTKLLYNICRKLMIKRRNVRKRLSFLFKYFTFI